MAREQRAVAVEVRITRGEHAHLAPALRNDLFDGAIERARPWACRAADERTGEGQVAPAAEHDLGGRYQPARGRREPLDAVLADADDHTSELQSRFGISYAVF